MLKKYYEIIFILIITFSILWFSFFSTPWAYFFLDFVFYPTDRIVNTFFETGLFYYINNIFSIIFWYALYSKIILFLIIFFSWFLWLKITTLLFKIFKFNKKYRFLSYWGILFMIMNPFFYERIITQTWFYLAILFLGYWLYYLLKNLEKKSLSNFLFVWLFFSLAISISPHIFFICAIILFFYLIIFTKQIKDLLYLFYSWLIIIFLNLNWLIGIIIWKSYVNVISSFSQSHIDTFISNSLNNLWVEFTNLLLYWFWTERYWHLLLPGMVIKKWFIVWFIVVIVVFFWFFKSFQKKLKLSFFLFLIGVVSYLLWVWTASNLFWGISQFLFDNIPFYIWFREPQKWIGVLQYVYLIFFIVWFYYIILFLDNYLNISKSKIYKSIIILVIGLLLFNWSPNVLFSFNNQLLITDYPKDYIKIKEELINSKEAYLLFPWHNYMACDWTKWKIVASIYPSFFYPINVSVSNNIEIWKFNLNNYIEKYKDIDLFLETEEISLLKKHNIKNIIFLDNCADYKDYNFLNNNEMFDLIKNKPSIKVYKIK